MAETKPDAAERKARREARREKQRAQSILRAQKMHKARIAADATVPAISQLKSNIHIGCSGWFYWQWRNCFYPKDSQPNEWFSHYAQKFDTVELNAPFYSWPTPGTVNTWISQTGNRPFIYTVKANELITHTKKFTGTKELVRDFGYIADLLGPHMGCLLFQLPPSYHYTPARLKAITGQLEQGRRNVVEFRHASWWNETVYKAFRKHNIIFCSCSGPRLPDELITTSDEIYLRLHGKKLWYRYNYSDEELAIWADRIRASGAKQIWVYFNNDYECHAIRNAETLRRLLTTPAKEPIMEKKKATPVWKKPAPKVKAKKTMTPAEKTEAKTRAKKAGRRYPNLVDNMAVTAKRGKK